MLGIREGTGLPENLSKLLGDFDTEVYGDFAVCPLTKSKPGVVQIICVQSADNLRAEKRIYLESAENSILPIEKLAAYENYTGLHIDETWIVSAHSERLDAQNMRSEILAYHFENNRWKRTFSKAFENSYNFACTAYLHLLLPVTLRLALAQCSVYKPTEPFNLELPGRAIQFLFR